jgi:UDP-N-acetylenolpyruvoylglucosamine reductase
VGAYGQEVSDTLAAVRALDRESGRVVTLAPAECGFGYRDSLFKSRAPGRYVVLAVTYRLVPGGAPYLGYADIARVGTASPRWPSARDRDPRAAPSPWCSTPGIERAAAALLPESVVDAARLPPSGLRPELTMPRSPSPTAA